MLKRIRKLLKADGSPKKRFDPTLPKGQRIYAIGDIHGRRDLFKALLRKIEADDAKRGSADTLIVLLGDLVDRGPDSAGVVKAARKLAQQRPVRVLMGNHEEMFLRALKEDRALAHFLRVGGRETVLSYGIDRKAYRAAELSELRAMLKKAVPEKDIAFLKSMEDYVKSGDYLFVHAGIVPGIAIDKQKGKDLRWIREPFLHHPTPYGHCVIHGHTIRRKIDVWPSPKHPFRIGIDTGAYDSGRLTAIGLQGSDRWFMDTRD